MKGFKIIILYLEISEQMITQMAEKLNQCVLLYIKSIFYRNNLACSLIPKKRVCESFKIFAYSQLSNCIKKSHGDKFLTKSQQKKNLQIILFWKQNSFNCCEIKQIRLSQIIEYNLTWEINIGTCSIGNENVIIIIFDEKAKILYKHFEFNNPIKN